MSDDPLEGVDLSGRYLRLDEHGVVEDLPTDARLDYWICPRVDEPWTWRVLSNQRQGECTRCGAGIIYRVSERSPTQPVSKVCRPCMSAMLRENARPAGPPKVG